MNLKLVDAAIAAYTPQLDEKAQARLSLFRAIWEEQNRLAERYPICWNPPEATRVYELAHERTALLADVPLALELDALEDAVSCILAVLDGAGALATPEQVRLRELSWRDVLSQADLSCAGQNPSAYLNEIATVLSGGAVGGVADDDADGGATDDPVADDAAPDTAADAGAKKGASQSDSAKNDARTTAVAPQLSAEAAHYGALVVSLALRPFLKQLVPAARTALKDAKTDELRPQHCPICGSAPSVARVSEEGAGSGRQRSLWCPQCSNHWHFDRVRCVHCGTRNQESLHFFHIDEDEAHRIGLCDECGEYIRVVYVDKERVLAPFSFDVEDVIMARLDALAADPSFADKLHAHPGNH